MIHNLLCDDVILLPLTSIGKLSFFCREKVHSSAYFFETRTATNDEHKDKLMRQKRNIDSTSCLFLEENKISKWSFDPSVHPSRSTWSTYTSNAGSNPLTPLVSFHLSSISKKKNEFTRKIPSFFPKPNSHDVRMASLSSVPIPYPHILHFLPSSPPPLLNLLSCMEMIRDGNEK